MDSRRPGRQRSPADRRACIRKMADSQHSHFKLLASGLSAEPLAALGEALLALQQARTAAASESSAAWLAAGGRLDNACQGLLSALLAAHGTALNAQQWLFA